MVGDENLQKYNAKTSEFIDYKSKVIPLRFAIMLGVRLPPVPSKTKSAFLTRFS